MSSVNGARNRRSALIVVCALVPAAAACSASNPGTGASATAAVSTPAASPGASASPSPSSMGMSHGASPASTERGAGAGVRLESLVAQHSVLVADMMRARILRAPDVAQSADAALSTNTQALGSLVDSLFGADAGAKFAQLWSGHIRYFYDYADALAASDKARLAASRKGLAGAEAQLGAFFAGASAGRLRRADAVAAVRTHVDHLLAQADAFHAGNYSAAANYYTVGYEHGFAMGGALAGALLPKPDAAQLNRPEWTLRSGLTNLLGEHVALVVAAMRAATGAPADFTALAASLDANTRKLGSAVDSLYGHAAANRFQNLWADHVDALMAYTASTVKGDNAGSAAAQSRLRTFEPALAGFLAAATKSTLGAQALARAYNEHDQMLVGELAAYQAKDYNQAHTLTDQAYDQMFDLSGQLSHAIGITLGAKLPKGGSQTGGGGMARVVSRR